MLFNSAIFLFVFLPITVLGFYTAQQIAGRSIALTFLFAASLVFYGWWDIRYLPLLLGSICFNFLIGEFLFRYRSGLVLGFGVAGNLALLGIFKYADFALTSFTALTGGDASLLHLALPLGISFFTFQQIVFLVDIWRGKIEKSGARDFGLFVAFFPQLIAGPIVHYAEIVPQFKKTKYNEVSRNLAIGSAIFIIGLGKKILIADSLSPYSTGAFGAADAGAQVSFAVAWTGTLAYSLQIYFDFSGYSDMALGLGRMFGFQLPINFNSPYKAVSIVDFWRRWHITLSHFLRDYLYIPLGGNRHGEGRWLANLMITMVLGGLWHGAAWTFFVWGGLHGLYLVVNRLWSRSGRQLPKIFGMALTFLAVTLAWVFFRSETFAGAATILTAMAGIGGFTLDAEGQVLGLIAGALAMVWILPNTAQLFEAEMTDWPLKQAGVQSAQWKRPRFEPRTLPALGLGLVLCAIITKLWATSEFIYFQF